MEIKKVEQAIVGAFAAVQRPGRDELAPHVCEECDELASDFSALVATEVPVDVLEKHAYDLALFSADAKHYFLPAWLLHGLVNDGPWLSDVSSSVIHALEDDAHRWDPSSPYSLDQWSAVACWLEYVARFADDVDLEGLGRASARVQAEIKRF